VKPAVPVVDDEPAIAEPYGPSSSAGYFADTAEAGAVARMDGRDFSVACGPCSTDGDGIGLLRLLKAGMPTSRSSS
jgi:hypothetical protein